jgi:1-aminocyclopropane-1-carboxylate deaminase/D-cysteine desulfhydrase-like pyridoxal-dependent ACC family enzyme
MGVRIFLSHSSRDREPVESIRSQADAVGVDVYLFSDDLHPGENTAEKLQQVLRECQALVVLITSNSVQSQYVNQEIGFAKALGLPIIPLVESGVPPDRLAMLLGVDHIPFDRDDVQPALAQLTRVLHRLEQRQVAPVPGVSTAAVQLTGQDVAVALMLIAVLLLLAYSAGASFGRP